MNQPRRLPNIWCEGSIFAFSGIDGPTAYAENLIGEGSFDAPGISFTFPAPGTIRFPDGDIRVDLVTSDAFDLGIDGRRIRGAFVDACHMLVQGPVQVEIDSGLSMAQDGDLHLIGVAAHFDKALLHCELDLVIAARLDWLCKLDIPKALDEAQARAFLKAASILKSQIYTPEGGIAHTWSTPDKWPHRHMWLWDSAFHAIGWRHLDPTIARDLISAVFDKQRDDGFISHMMTPETATGITQPPVLAYAAKLVHEVDPQTAWIEDLYPRIHRYLAWNEANRDRNGNGLLEWQIDGDPRCRCGESGLDNSSRFDEAALLDAVDFNSFMAKEYETLAQFARILGRSDDIATWQEKHRRYCDRINKLLWNDEAEFYFDRAVEVDKHSGIYACTGFLPLFCGACSLAQVDALSRHLWDADSFGTALPIASIGRRNDAIYEKDMWRGPSWLNISWAVAEGFSLYEQHTEAMHIRDRWCRVIADDYVRHGTIFEYYDDRQEVAPPALLRKQECHPRHPHRVLRDYGWSAALYIDWCMRFSLT